MIRLLKLFSILILALALGLELSHDPGYIMIATQRWSLETSFWIAIPVLIAIFLILTHLLAIYQRLRALPEDFSRWLSQRRLIKGRRQTLKGFIEFNEGQWSKAQTHLINASKDATLPLVNYLTAARAAHETGNKDLRDEYLRLAQEENPEAKTAIQLTQAQLQVQNHQWQEALDLLSHLHQTNPRHPYLLKLLLKTHQAMANWDEVKALLPRLKHLNILSPQVWLKTQELAYINQLKQIIPDKSPEYLNAWFQNLPRNLKTHPKIIYPLAKLKIESQDDRSAESLLRNALKQEFDEHLIGLYGLLKNNSANLTWAESLIAKNPQSAALYLSLARISSQKTLWGKAKSYLHESLKLKPSAEAYHALGKIYERLDLKDKASETYLKGLEQALLEQ